MLTVQQFKNLMMTASDNALWEVCTKLYNEWEDKMAAQIDCEKPDCQEYDKPKLNHDADEDYIEDWRREEPLRDEDENWQL